MKPLRVLVADDERMARRRLQRMLADLAGVEVVAVCEDGDQVLGVLDREQVDVAILDIRMPGKSGLQVAELAADWGVEIIFATAHPDHAVEAFEEGVVDYVLKPIEAERLALAIDRARARLVREAPAPAGGQAERLAFNVLGEVRLVSPGDVTHAVLEGELVSVFVKGEALLTDVSLTDLERRLPSGRFARVHRRALLNLDKVDRLKPLPSGGYLAVTACGREVPVSRQAARALRRRLGIS